ncbi:MAG: nucleoside-diphosphate kinase, partial [Bryobacteraceae bacterium]|nr:nucleoside-diphosphate kinase [Bryobacteraceae bacterium]
MSDMTFGIIKPDAVAAGHTGKILAMIEEAGFTVKAMRMTRISKAEAEGFYAVHKERPFFPNLVAFMTEGPVVVMALQRENAV